jgi:PhnB protein
MKLNPYLSFNGQCEAAFKFYEQCLGGKIEMMMTHRESPMAQQTPAGWLDKIIHARMTVGHDVLMGGDLPPEHYEASKGFSVTLGVENPADAERVFNALAIDGTVRMPLQKTFWSTAFGMLVDRFGIPWIVNCEQAA